MMRLFLSFVAVALLTAATPARRDWTQAVVATPAGGYLMGNPQAAVKLVEYGSFTCPHCAHFAREADAPLRQRLVRSGRVSFEFRNLIRDRLDLAAVVLARCAGPRGFFPAAQAIFAAQEDWLTRGATYGEANAQRLALQPPLQQMRAQADAAGLIGVVRARGLTDRAIATCLADQAAVDRIVAMRVPPEVKGTPAFFINGKLAQGVYDWPTLQPRLAAAGVR